MERPVTASPLSPPTLTVGGMPDLLSDDAMPENVLASILGRQSASEPLPSSDVRRLSAMDNSLRRAVVSLDESESDDDDDDDDAALKALQQKGMELSKSGTATTTDGGGESDSDDSGELAAMMAASAQRASQRSAQAASTSAVSSSAPARVKKVRPAKELATQLKFLGKQFNAIKSDDVKHVVDAERAKRSVYTFEWEANEQKPEWKQALLLSTMRPADGLKYLTGLGLIKNTTDAKAKWLSHYRKMVLDNSIVIEWLCLDGNQKILEVRGAGFSSLWFLTRPCF